MSYRFHFYASHRFDFYAELSIQCRPYPDFMQVVESRVGAVSPPERR
jgi:hypothetical protein